MRILLIGSGCREHAIAKAIINSSSNPHLFCISNVTNPGIQSLAQGYAIAAVTDVEKIVAYAQSQHIDLVIVGPEDSLAAGVSDALRIVGIKVVGPTRNHAQLESSKRFARSLIQDYNIDGNPFFQHFDSMDGVRETLERYAEHFVIKPDGLCGGKGVVVWGDHLHTMQDAIEHCESLIQQNRPFIIEEKLDGQEFSLIAFTDGKHLIQMPLVQDHKRAFVGDTGPNTGGMGTYSDSNHLLPFISEQDCKDAQSINQAVVDALFDTFGTPYQGMLYGGFMATADGVKVIEYNVRFGDPEAMNLLTLFEGDFVHLAHAITNGTLDTIATPFRKQATVCKYVVPNGYPTNPEKGFSVEVPVVNDDDDVHLFMGAVDEKDGTLIATGSRTLAILALGNTIAEAERMAEEAISHIKGNLFHRPDIGTKDLINTRIRHMNSLRGNVYTTL